MPGSPNKRMKEEEVERKLAEQQAEAEAKAKTRGPPGLGGGISKKLETCSWIDEFKGALGEAFLSA